MTGFVTLELSITMLCEDIRSIALDKGEIMCNSNVFRL